MSGRDKDTLGKARKALARTPGSADYEVGFGKPPASGRFQPGKSGNPRGRPKGSRNRAKLPALNEERLKAIILEEAYRTISINDARGQAAIPMAQAILRSLAVNAAKGNQRAQQLFTELLSAAERDNKRLHDEWLATAINYKVEWERELDRRTRLGITGPEPLPHPDHVLIDLQAGTANIRGPATKEEKLKWDAWQQYKTMFEEELRELHSLRDDPQGPDQQELVGEIARTQKVLSIIENVLRSGRIPDIDPPLGDLAARTE